MDHLAEIQQAITASDAPTDEFLELSRTHQREVFFLLPRALQEALVEGMEGDDLQKLVRRLDPDEVADILEMADDKTRDEVLRRLDEDHRERVEFLLGFAPESAAGLMNLDYITVDDDKTL